MFNAPIDWRQYLPDSLDVAETADGRLVVTFGDRSRLAWRRYTPWPAIAWLLGYYQAEGNKTGMEWSIDSVEPRLLARTADVLRDVLVIPPVDLKLSAPEATIAMFERVGVPVRIRSKTNAGHLSVRDSRWLVEAFKQVLTQLVEHGRLLEADTSTQREFALGYLDGDGNITVTATEVSLRLAGLRPEVELVDQALRNAFQWAPKGKLIDKTSWVETRRTLTAQEIGDLLAAGAFPFSMNRARLFDGWRRRLTNLRNVTDPANVGQRGVTNIWRRWGLVEGNAFTPAAHALLARYTQLEPELLALDAQPRPPKGQKGAAYPLNPIEWPRPPRVAYQRSLADRIRCGDPRQPLPEETLQSMAVREVSKAQARPIIELYEWLGDLGACTTFYGLWHGDDLLGVAGFGSGTGPKAHRICDGVDAAQTIGLLRGACVHWAPRNAASFLISRACAAAHRDHGWRVFFAYADEEAGEIGEVYQATNWRYIGKNIGATSPMRERYVTRDRVYSKRYSSAKGDYFYPAVPKHKYVWFEGDRRARRALQRACRYPALPYPKRVE